MLVLLLIDAYHLGFLTPFLTTDNLEVTLVTANRISAA